MALFPPAIGGSEQVDYGYKGKGVLMHLITDHRGMPLRICNTAANGDERKQALCMLNTLPRSKTMRFFQADKGYDCRWLRQKLMQKGYYPIIAHRTFVRKKTPS